MAQHAGKFGAYVVGETSRLLVPSRHKRSHKRQIFGGLAGAELVRCRIALEVRLEDLSPGDRLPDAGVISQALGVSEITVRRTLETMDQDGLLERRRGRAGGTFIAERWDSVVAAMRNDQEAVQLVEFQLVLECGLAARACGELSPEDLAELGRHNQSTQTKRDRDSYALADARFHLSLAMVLGGWQARERQTDLLGKLCLLLPKPAMDVATEQNRAHLLLLTALENGSVETAIEALKMHAHCWPPTKVS